METAFTTPVHAREETVWKVLMDKVERPEKYVPGIDGCRIVERTPDGLVRAVSAGGATFHEKVTFDPDTAEITFTLLDHPLYTGCVINRAGGTSRQSPVAPTMLTFIMEWSRREGNASAGEVQRLADSLRRAALAVKDAAEDLDAEWSGDEEAEQGKEVVPEEYRYSRGGPIEQEPRRA